MRISILLLALLLSPPAFTQATAAPSPAPASSVTERLGTQLATLIADPVQRANALELTLLVAETRPEIDLSATVDPLVDVYETDADVRHRRAAAVALAAIGNPTGMQRLAELSRYEPNERLRQTTVQLLGAYVATLPTHKAATLNFAVSGAE